MHTVPFIFAGLVSLVVGQGIDPKIAEEHPVLPTQKCTKDANGGPSVCTPMKTSVVMEELYRNLVLADGVTSCYNISTVKPFNNIDAKFNMDICTDPDTCAAKCFQQGFTNKDYFNHGITTSLDKNGSITLQLLPPGDGGDPNVKHLIAPSPRVYLLSEDKNKYQVLKLKNMEFTFDVDMSQMPCGVNAPLIFAAMPEDGGMGQGNNTAGATFGNGFCDPQCQTAPRFVAGRANIPDPNSPPADQFLGRGGNVGNCCAQIEVSASNMETSVLTTHTCNSPTQQTTCMDGSPECAQGGICDHNGCKYNSYMMGDTMFYGPGTQYTINTMKPFTIITQFLTSDNTVTGVLKEIKRMYVQDGKLIENGKNTLEGMKGLNTISDEFCATEAVSLNGTDVQAKMGGMAQLDKHMDYGWVLSLSIWDSPDGMTWFDSTTQGESKVAFPGQVAGRCNVTEDKADFLEKAYPDSQIVYNNIRWGDIGSTY